MLKVSLCRRHKTYHQYMKKTSDTLPLYLQELLLTTYDFTVLQTCVVH